MTIATVALPILLAAFDIGEAFKETEAGEESAVDFAVDRAKDGFKFTDAKRTAVVCMRRGACIWNGLEVWEARIHYGTAGGGATRIELSLYNRGDDSEGSGLSEEDFKAMQEKICAALSPAKPGAVGKKELRNGGFRHSQSWAKCDPAVELTWGTTGGKAQGREVDFVRLTLRPKNAPSAARKKAGTTAKGGHMRLIIGYNPQTKEILYTDTWGAGHELKRMPEDWAFTITHDAFFLRPL